MLELTDIKSKIVLTDSYRALHSRSEGYISFSAHPGTFLEINYTFGHKASLNRDKKIEITPCILSHQHWLKLVINNRKKKEWLKTPGN